MSLKVSKIAMSSIVAALLSFTSISSFGQQKSGAQQADAKSMRAEEVIKTWKEKPQKVAQEMMKKYGEPQEVTSQRLIWHNNGPWKRSELINEEIEHKFPMPHKDMLMQTVAFEVPADKFDELAAFDGSVVVERTRGELSARCDKEAANLLAVNLAHDIITNKKSVDEARKVYADQIVAMAQGKSAPLTAKLAFQPMKNAADPDKMTMDQATAEKVKKMMQEKEQTL